MKWVKNGLLNAGQEFQFLPAGAEDICSPLSTGNMSQDDWECLWYLALPELRVDIVRRSAFHSRRTQQQSPRRIFFFFLSSLSQELSESSRALLGNPNGYSHCSTALESLLSQKGLLNMSTKWQYCTKGSQSRWNYCRVGRICVVDMLGKGRPDARLRQNREQRRTARDLITSQAGWRRMARDLIMPLET